MAGSPKMRGWQWKALQKQEQEQLGNWMPRQFRTDATPLPELLASPAKQGLLHSLMYGGLGALGGGLVGHGLNQAFPESPVGAGAGALFGGGLGGVLGGLHGYGAQRKDNDQIIDALRRSPPGATVGDYHALQEADRQRAKLGSALMDYVGPTPAEAAPANAIAGTIMHMGNPFGGTSIGAGAPLHRRLRLRRSRRR